MTTEFIRFLAHCEPDDGSGTVFHEGTIHEMNPASARHWVRRKKAEYVEDDEESAAFDEQAVDGLDGNLAGDTDDDFGEDPADDPADGPVHTGGGMWQLPDGRRIKGKAAAFEAFAASRTLDDEPLPDPDPEDIAKRTLSDG